MNGYHFDWLAVLSGPPRQWLLSGLLTTLELTLCASVLATAIAVALLGLRLLPSRPARTLAAAYVAVFRNTPLAVQFLFWYFGGIGLLPSAWRTWLNAPHHAVGLAFPSLELLVGVWGLGLFSAAFVAEDMRAGMRAVARGQIEAGRSLGLGAWQTLRLVVLPQALAHAWQPLIGQYLNLMKNSTLAMSIAVAELCYQANQIESYNFHAIEAFAVVSAIYLGLGLLLSALLQGLGNSLLPSWRRNVRH
ncbi:amino acid ABC transporter permease [Paludibacterium yongneupense]|uniref:amino acid ABC transporter permease n=1 Tax=Paludibacterium yongneupense TaxID=400061 RepID=UPI00041EF452|nr:amino acid ABC transporter permease [Paludibacterium yongneupense]